MRLCWHVSLALETVSDTNMEHGNSMVGDSKGKESWRDQVIIPMGNHQHIMQAQKHTAWEAKYFHLLLPSEVEERVQDIEWILCDQLDDETL